LRPEVSDGPIRVITLDGVGPVLFVKSRRARRITLTVRASRGVRVAVHLRIRGHGRDFWAEIERRMPDARRRQARLREYALALF